MSGLAGGDFGADGGTLGGAVDLLVLSAGFLEGGEVKTDDGAGSAGDLTDAALGLSVVLVLLVETTVSAGPEDEAGVLLALVEGEGLRAFEGEDGLGGDEGEGNVAATVAGVDNEVGEFTFVTADHFSDEGVKKEFGVFLFR